MLPHTLPARVSDVPRQDAPAASSDPTRRAYPTRSLCALGLKPRTLHSLSRAGVFSVSRLCKLRENELLLLPGIGRGSIAAITAALAGCLLTLDVDDHERF